MKLVGNIFLSIIARFLLWLLSALLIMASCIINLCNGKTLTDYFWELACVLDEVGNVIGGPFWNLIFLRNNPVALFGSRKHTMSQILGINKSQDKLNKFALAICWIVEKINPGHMERAAIVYKLNNP